MTAISNPPVPSVRRAVMRPGGSSATITPRRLVALKAIAAGLLANGVPPTLRELADAMDVSSTSVVSYHLDCLMDGGYLTRVPGAARALRITDKGRAELGEPDLVTAVRDAIAAGAHLPDTVVAAFEAVA